MKEGKKEERRKEKENRKKEEILVASLALLQTRIKDVYTCQDACRVEFKGQIEKAECLGPHPTSAAYKLSDFHQIAHFPMYFSFLIYKMLISSNKYLIRFISPVSSQ